MKTVLSILFSLFLIVQAQAQTMGLSGGSVPQYVPNAWDFNGSSSRMFRNSDFSGNADGQLGILSFWYRNDGAGSNQVIAAAQGSSVEILNDTSGAWTIILRDESADVITITNQTIRHNGDGAWHHYMTSWNTGTDTFYLYIDDTEDLSGAPDATDNDIDYTRTNHEVSGVSSTQLWDGCIADLYINWTEFIDLSVTSNRRKFINVNGKPVYLGSDGSGPTGTQPIVYLKNAYDSFTTNSGSGGNYTTAADVTACGTAP